MNSKTSKKLLALIPAYNEARTIGGVLDELLAKEIVPVVINDGSTDETESITRSKGVKILNHVLNRGQGAALSTGFLYARMQDIDCVITFDADGQHSVVDIETLTKPILEGSVDVVLGSRFLKENKIPRSKQIVLKLATLYTRLSTGLQVTDTHNGLRALSPKAVESIMLTQAGMAHASELLAQISKKRLSYVESPVTIAYTEYAMQKGQRLSNSFRILFDLWFK